MDTHTCTATNTFYLVLKSIQPQYLKALCMKCQPENSSHILDLEKKKKDLLIFANDLLLVSVHKNPYPDHRFEESITSKLGLVNFFTSNTECSLNLVVELKFEILET